MTVQLGSCSKTKNPIMLARKLYLVEQSVFFNEHTYYLDEAFFDISTFLLGTGPMASIKNSVTSLQNNTPSLKSDGKVKKIFFIKYECL